MLRIRVLILGLFFLSGLRAQQARQYSFTHFTTSNGLSSNIVQGVVQDKDGYIWLSSVNGLQRYDGHTFLSFRSEEGKKGSLLSDNLPVLYKDRNHTLWVVDADNHVGTFDTRTFTFSEVPVQTPEKRSVYFPKYFIETPDGQLLLHERFHGLYRFDRAARKFVPAAEVLPTPKGWNRQQYMWDPLIQKYWSTGDSGLVLYDPVTRHLSYRGHNVDNDPVIRMMEKELLLFGHHVDSKGVVIFLSWAPKAGGPTIHKIDRRTGSYVKMDLGPVLGLNYHELNGTIEQRSGRMWSFGLSFLAEWNADRTELKKIPNEFRNEQSLKFDQSYAVYEDKESNLWIATDNGLFLFNPDAQVFNAYNLVRPGYKASVEAPVQAVLETTDGSIFVGCWGRGLFYFDKNFNPLPLPASLQARQDVFSIWDMYQHSKTGQIWIVLQDGEIVVYDPKTKKMRSVRPEVFGGRTIRQVVEDYDGNLWFGSQHGRIVKWNLSAGDPGKGYELVYQTHLVHKLHTDDLGFIWAGTSGSGLLKFNPKTNKLVQRFDATGKAGERLYSNVLTDITQYNDSIMILTAGCVNVMNTRTGKITFISTADGLPSNMANSIQKDSKGILWVGMVNGLSRLNLERKIISNYDRRDGIPHDNFIVAGVEKLSDGRILFYTDHNFLAFQPEQFVQQSNPPKPVITSFMLEGKPLLIDSLRRKGKLVLHYDNTSIAIDFSGLNFIKQKKLHYFYKLENVDKDWIHTDNSSEAIYNYLPPGEYQFRVKSENADGITSPEEQSFIIEVRPPVWRTWWFYGLIILLVVLILYLIDKERVKRMKSLQQVRTQIAGNLHRDINTTLNNINVLSEIAKIKADKDVERSKDFIDQISSKSRTMIEAMDDMLWSINPENDSMKKTLLRIRELTEGIKATYGTSIDLIVDYKVQELQLEMKQRHELYFFYKEAILYILQHTCRNQIFVHFKQRKSKMLLEILSECNRDLQHFDAHFRSAVGERMLELGASMDIVSDKQSISVLLQMDV